MVTVIEFKQLVLSLHNVVEQPHFEKQSYRVKKKILATLDEEKKQIVIKLNEIQQSVFCTIDKTMIYPVAGAWGKKGWTIIELIKVPKDLLSDALETAYRIATSKQSADKI